MRKTKPQSFSCTPEKWEALEPIAKELGISRNQLISKLVDLTLENEGIDFATATPTQSSIDAELKAEQLVKAKNQNSLHKIKSRKLEAETKIKEYHAGHLDVIGSSPSATAHRAMESHVTGNQAYDKDAIYCPDCKWHTNSNESIQWQIDRITDHVKSTHRRNFTEEEAKIISELLV